MKDFFSRAGQASLLKFLNKDNLFAFDFDGTLAPIVDKPDDAYIPPRRVNLLKKLNRLAPVAIISGRAVKDLKPRLGFKPDYLIGNHGLEGTPDSEEMADEAARVSRVWRETLENRGEIFSEDPGVFIEDKTFSLSLHYRQAEEPKRAQAQLKRLLRELKPAPRVVLGHCIFNLMPKKAIHKGLALKQVLKQEKLKSAIFIGDDVTDEDVFRLRTRQLYKLRVGRHSDTRAEFYVKHLEDIDRVLTQFLEAFES